MQIAGEVISQITNHFSGKIFFDFIFGYKIVILLMLLGYIMHFIPRSIESKSENWVINSSLTVKACLVIAVIVLVIQTKSAGIQPFIYFQF